MTRKLIVVIYLFVLISSLHAQQFIYKNNWSFPKPEGNFGVGTTTLHLIDSTREEIISKTTNDSREIMFRVWYPANIKKDDKPLRYLEGYSEKLGDLWIKFGMPENLLRELQKKNTYSYPDADPEKTENGFPVIIFSPGYALPVIEMYSSMLENIASYGYIVFAAAHPYEIAEVVYPDKHTINLDSTRFRTMLREGKPEWELSNSIKDSVKKREIEIETVKESFTLNSSLNFWVEDIRFLIDELFQTNSPKIKGMFSGIMNLKKIGVLGHSFGGAAAGQLCLIDKRVSAGINLDGTQFGDILENDLSKPFMMIYSEEGDKINDNYFAKSSGPIYFITIRNSEHISFGNGFYWQTNKMDSKRFSSIVNTCIKAFFDKYLKEDSSSDLENISNIYQEVQVRKK